MDRSTALTLAGIVLALILMVAVLTPMAIIGTTQDDRYWGAAQFHIGETETVGYLAAEIKPPYEAKVEELEAQIMFYTDHLQPCNFEAVIQPITVTQTEPLPEDIVVRFDLVTVPYHSGIGPVGDPDRMDKGRYTLKTDAQALPNPILYPDTWYFLRIRATCIETDESVKRLFWEWAHPFPVEKDVTVRDYYYSDYNNDGSLGNVQLEYERSDNSVLFALTGCEWMTDECVPPSQNDTVNDTVVATDPLLSGLPDLADVDWVLWGSIAGIAIIGLIVVWLLKKKGVK